MKKNNFNSIILLFLFTILLMSCGSSTHQEQKQFAKMIEEIANPSITFHTDYEIYAYEIGHEDKKETLQRFDVFAKMTSSAYDLVAYYNHTSHVASSFHLEKDEQGYVVKRYVDIHNTLQTTRTTDHSGQTFLWEESVYLNQIGKLKASDFTKVDNHLYRYTSDLHTLPLTLLHTAIPVSTFRLASFLVTTEENHITSFLLQEQEDDGVYQGYMYGRTVTIRFEEMGTTEIDYVVPYATSEENIPLKNALKKMQETTNYTITVDAESNEETIRLSETKITEEDIYQIQSADEKEVKRGLHTLNHTLYQFASVNDTLLGIETNSSLIEFLPSFDFSEDIFQFQEVINEERKYIAYPGMIDILDLIDYQTTYAEEYDYASGDIAIYIKDESLSHIDFPVYTYIHGTPTLATIRISYSSFHTTTISSVVWDHFIFDFTNQITDWNDDNLSFSLILPDQSEKRITPYTLFFETMHDTEAIPFFLPSNTMYEVTAEILQAENQVVLSLYSPHAGTSENIARMKTQLQEQGFVYEPIDEGIAVYIKNNIEIAIFTAGNVLSIDMYLPLGTLLSQ